MQHMPYVTLTLPQDCIIPTVRRFAFVWIGSERRGAGATWEAKKGGAEFCSTRLLYLTVH